MPHADAQLPNDHETLKAMLIAERARSERLVQIIKEMQRHRFGRRAETLPEDQMLLALEEAEQVEAGSTAEEEARSAEARAQAAGRRRRNRSALPANLPRIETTVDIEGQSLPLLQRPAAQIGEDVSERGKSRTGPLRRRGRIVAPHVRNRSCKCRTGCKQTTQHGDE